MRNSLTATYKAMIRHPDGVRLEQRSIPKIGVSELLLMPLVAGLCGTDIQILRGERDEKAAVIGHEGIAQIVQVGIDCPSELTPGRFVLINPTHRTRTDFLLGHEYDGLFQEYVHLPAPVVTDGLVVPLDDVFDLEIAPLIEPLAAVLYAFQLLQPQARGGAMMIYGDGIIGHLAILLARIRFGSTLPIIFIHHTEEGLAWSKAQHIHGDVDLLFSELCHAQMPTPHSILLATPRTATLNCLSHAINCVAPQGRIDMLGGLPNDAHLASLPFVNLIALRAANCAGFPSDGVLTPVTTKENKLFFLFGQRGVSNHHLLDAVKELNLHHLQYKKLISHTLNLRDATLFMHQLSRNGLRKINGQRVMKLSIHIHTPTHTRYLS